MKKIIMLFLFSLVSIVVFADLQIGPTAMYNFAITNEDDISNDIGITDFTFGVDTRINLGLLQGSAYILYTPGDEYYYPLVEAFFDVGVTLDLILIRLSAGVGPSFEIVIIDDEEETETESYEAGFNMKVGGDLQLSDSVSLGLVYITDVDLTVEDISEAFKNIDGFFGISMLFTF